MDTITLKEIQAMRVDGINIDCLSFNSGSPKTLTVVYVGGKIKSFEILEDKHLTEPLKESIISA